MQNDSACYSFLPIKYRGLHDFFMKQSESYWIPAEIDMSKDKRDWETLSKEEKRFIKMVLAFFAQFDGIVCENLVENFQRETASDTKEIGHFYAIQNAIEVIHNQTYSLLIENLIPSPRKRAKVLDAIRNYPSIQKMADWIRKWMDKSIPLVERIIAFAALEGVIFTAAFCAIHWFAIQEKLPGLLTANKFISRDETLHTNFAVALYHHFTRVTGKYKRVSPERCAEIIKSARDAKEDFVVDSLRLHTIRINPGKMMQYVERACDKLSLHLGYEEIYGVENPFEWMLGMGLSDKVNFFERIVTEYSRGLEDTENKENERAGFRIDDDF